MENQLSSTLEDYLEAIYHIESEKRAARVRDISKYLGVAKSTVNAALKSLARKKMVQYEPYELILLTEEGRETAADIVMNHRIMRDFLHDVLFFGDDKAEDVACKMEHAVDREVIERLVCFLAFIGKTRDEKARWVDEFKRFLSNGFNGKSCRDHMKEYMDAMPPFIDPQ
jgi:DtxR family Mn-dependent transcriptional regulator